MEFFDLRTGVAAIAVCVSFWSLYVSRKTRKFTESAKISEKKTDLLSEIMENQGLYFDCIRLLNKAQAIANRSNDKEAILRRKEMDNLNISCHENLFMTFDKPKYEFNIADINKHIATVRKSREKIKHYKGTIVSLIEDIEANNAERNIIKSLSQSAISADQETATIR